MKRLITTGSRDYKTYSEVVRGVSLAILDLTKYDNQLTVVHGACPTGADAFVDEFINKSEVSLRAYGIYVKQEKHPADWSKYGNAAGPIRNKEMVNLGADFALIFPQKGAANVGTMKTFDLIQEANINYQFYWSK